MLIQFSNNKFYYLNIILNFTKRKQIKNIPLKKKMKKKNGPKNQLIK